MLPNEKCIKGRPLLGYGKYVKKKWGKDGLEALEKALGYRFSDIAEDKWYPSNYSDELILWIAKNYGPGEVRNAARSMVSEVGVISFFARAAGMEKVLDRAMDEVRGSLSYGKITVDREEDGATVKLFGLSPNKENCEAWQGILEGAMALTKTHGRVEKTACENGGAEACVYKMTWKK